MRKNRSAGMRLIAATAAAAMLFAGIVPAEEPVIIEEVFTEAQEEIMVLEPEASGTAQPDDGEEVGQPADDQLLIATDELITEVTQEEAVPAVQETAGQSEVQTEEAAPAVELKGLRFAKDYKEVYEALKEADPYRYWVYEDEVDYAVEESAADSASGDAKVEAPVSAAAAPETEAVQETPEYSDTNVREAGVDEADVVKTDGIYLYMLYDEGRLSIVRADGAASELVSDTLLAEKETWNGAGAREMYVDGDLLTVIFEKYGSWSSRDLNAETYEPREQYIEAVTYDISDRHAPVLIGKTWQDGNYSQSRKIGDHIYLFSNKYFYGFSDYRDDELGEIIPAVNGVPVDAGEVCIPDHLENASYLIISSFDQNQAGTVIDRKVLVSGDSNLYVSQSNLYAMIPYYENGTERTEIAKFSYGNGLISGVGACRLKGRVNNTFSIDEYDGNLRVLTTYTGSETGAFLEALADLFGFYYYDEDRWVNHNALYILDEQLNMRSRLTGIARDEEIKSARYFGDTAYFVTFRQRDPLFTADLSDPDAPKLTGELHVSGFSAYLHPFGEGLLLGIGYDADENTGITTGLKLSMFDISDPTQVQELDRISIKGITWCQALDDYKTIFARPEKNLTGFFCDDRYMVFSYDREKGFTKVLHYDFYEDMLGGEAECSTTRGVYIGNELYLAGGSFVVGFDMENGFEKNLVLTVHD